mgnify:CR=1 FL=1
MSGYNIEYKERQKVTAMTTRLRKAQQITEAEWESFRKKAFRNKQYPSDRVIWLIKRDIK